MYPKGFLNGPRPVPAIGGIVESVRHYYIILSLVVITALCSHAPLFRHFELCRWLFSLRVDAIL